jgi:hypothetical protein
VVTKAKGRDSFCKAMRKKVPMPQPRITKVAGNEVLHFSFLEMLLDLLMSSKVPGSQQPVCKRRSRGLFFRVCSNAFGGLL